MLQASTAGSRRLSRALAWRWAPGEALLGPAFPGRLPGDPDCSTLNSAWDGALKAPASAAAPCLLAWLRPWGAGLSRGDLPLLPQGLNLGAGGVLGVCANAVPTPSRSDASPPHWLQALKLKKKKP